MNKRFFLKQTLKDLQQASFNYYLTVLLYLKELTKPIDNHTIFCFVFFISTGEVSGLEVHVAHGKWPPCHRRRGFHL